MKIGRGVSELWRVENRPLPLTWPMAYTTACTTVQAVITMSNLREFGLCNDALFWFDKLSFSIDDCFVIKHWNFVHAYAQ